MNMIDMATFVLAIAQIILQLGAAFLAYRLTRLTGAFRAWSLLIIALVFMAARRTTALLIEMGAMPALGGFVGFVDRIVLPLSISILLLLSMYELVRTFERQLKRQ